jgi:hypothetical protein
MSAMISADDLFQRHQNLMSMVHYAPPPPKPQQVSENNVVIVGQHEPGVIPDARNACQADTIILPPLLLNPQGSTDIEILAQHYRFVMPGENLLKV